MNTLRVGRLVVFVTIVGMGIPMQGRLVTWVGRGVGCYIAYDTWKTAGAATRESWDKVNATLTDMRAAKKKESASAPQSSYPLCEEAVETAKEAAFHVAAHLGGAPDSQGKILWEEGTTVARTALKSTVAAILLRG